MAIQFIEEDPWFFRSGYTKETILRRLKHAPLTHNQRVRLLDLLPRSITSGSRRLAKLHAALSVALDPQKAQQVAQRFAQYTSTPSPRCAAALSTCSTW